MRPDVPVNRLESTMRKTKLIGVAALAVSLSAGVAVAQPGVAARGGAGPGRGGASFFLAHTGDLKLSDAQVTRLAAIARRTEDRRRALRATMDSAGPMRMGPRPDSAARARMFDRMRTTMEREREQSHADLRDALGVLTPDQLATAWQMAPAGGRGGPDARRVREMRQRRMRDGGEDGPRRRMDAAPRRPANERPQD